MPAKTLKTLCLEFSLVRICDEPASGQIAFSNTSEKQGLLGVQLTHRTSQERPAVVAERRKSPNKLSFDQARVQRPG
jgi:hypothetical protein